MNQEDSREPPGSGQTGTVAEETGAPTDTPTPPPDPAPGSPGAPGGLWLWIRRILDLLRRPGSHGEQPATPALKSALKSMAHGLYYEALRQSRQGEFYERGGVPDTLDGRFELVVLHVYLIGERLEGLDEAQMRELRRLLTERMIDDLDRSLREMGVGDLGVGKRIRPMFEAWRGRLQAYRAAEDPAALSGALMRNVYATARDVPAGAPSLLASYVARARVARFRLGPGQMRTVPVLAWPSLVENP